MEIDFDALMNEAQEYLKLRKEFKSTNNPPAGSIGYLISLDWTTKYKKYIHYDSLRRNIKPTPSEDAVHPGKITNSDFLETNSQIFLSGSTSTDKGSEPECLDRYIQSNASENKEFEVISDEMWELLAKRYGFDYEVRRYYIKGQWSYSTSLEITYKHVPVLFIFAEQLPTMEISEESLQVKTIQVRKTANYGDLKKRIADCASKMTQGTIKTEEIRLWSVCSDDDILGKISLVADSLRLNANMAQQSTEDCEENSGVDCPGQKSLEPFIGTTMTLEEKSFVNNLILVEVSANGNFAFRYKKQERVVFGKCEWCGNKNLLNSICSCKRVRYCDDDCLEKDKRFHIPSCSAQVDEELNELNFEKHKSVAPKNGCVGLQNLGNTCFMNSSLQCLSNTYELTKFFLDQRFKYIQEMTVKNPLGTDGRLVMAYARTLNEMWNMDQSTVSPSMFKRILGEYATQFQGYDQHDSHECISTILDLLGEDLYRKGKKPYIDMDEKEGQEEEVAAKEAWNRHVFRNESIITDLFHGQFKSTVSCLKCDRVSVTFDPMMTMLLPIPSKKIKCMFFFVPFQISEGYINYSCAIEIRSSNTIMDLRNSVAEKYGRSTASYTITKVHNNEFTRYFSTQMTVDQLYNEGDGKYVICYEADPKLNPSFPNIQSQIDKCDSNNGIDQRYTRLVLGVSTLVKQQYSQRYSKDFFLPRLLWVDKQINLKQLHLHVFTYFRQVLAEWIDWKSPQTKKVPKEGEKFDLRTSLIDFPYQLQPDVKITKEQFMSMSPQECYELCFSGMINGGLSIDEDLFDIQKMPYKLVFKDISGYYEPCCYCNTQRCGGCNVPYTEEMTVGKILNELKLDSNNTLFSEDRRGNSGKELQLHVVWHQDINKNLFSFLSTAIPMPLANGTSEDEQSSSDVKLTDCLKMFKQQETLDDQNLWYCKKCKDHVRATKSLEIFRVPRVLIISLKRFKTSKQKYGYGMGSQKIETLVDFPLEGLDMSPFVLSKSQKASSPLIYDLYAVSNHSGGVGGGHYTAFGKNYLTGQWYEFDDSRCRSFNGSTTEGRREIVSDEAYSLFYRLRDNSDLRKLDFEKIKQQPDQEFLQALKEYQEAKTKKK